MRLFRSSKSLLDYFTRSYYKFDWILSSSVLKVGPLSVWSYSRIEYLPHQIIVLRLLLPGRPFHARAKMEVKTAGIIVIGDEVLKGQVADQNVHFLAKKLHLLGIKLCKVSIVPDIIEDIAKEVAEYSVRYDRVITTGGIGPTHDDMTYEGIAAAFQDTLLLNEELLTFWSWFNKDPEGIRLESSIKMATVPKSAKIVYTEMPRTIVPVGKFPVVTINNVCVFPGIPFYLKAIFNSLQGTYFVSSGVTFHVRRLYLNVFESVFSEHLTKVAKQFEKTVVFGSYPKVNQPEYKTLITIESQQAKDVDDALASFKGSLKAEWLVNNCDVLSESWSSTKEQINYGDLEASFIDNLNRSLQLMEKVFEDYNHDEIYLAFNGGKDCTALLHLAHTIKNKRDVDLQQESPPLTAVYFKPKNPIPEVEAFIRQTSTRYNVNLITEEGPIKEAVERLSKTEVGKKWKVVLMGTRKADPIGKNLQHFQKTDAGWANLIRVSPILDWSYKEVWTYLRNFSVNYCSLYDEGFTSLDDSVGCERNPTLKYTDEAGNVKYKPAYALEDETTERSGRR